MAPRPLPSYRLHRASGRAVVTLSGRTYYLGAYGSPESRREYQRLLRIWLDRGASAPPTGQLDLTVNEVLLRFMDHARSYYRRPDGSLTPEPVNILLSVRELRELYEHELADEITPARLKDVQRRMIRRGLKRRVINQRIGRIKRAWKWAASEGLIQPSTWHGLQTVEGLRFGRTEARESEPVRPVATRQIAEVIRQVSPQVGAMIRLQWLTAMRPGEVCQMRAADIDRSGPVWIYRPRTHKTAYRGRGKEVMLGPKAQRLLRPFIAGRNPESELFSPAESAEWHRPASKRRGRRRRSPGSSYTTTTYAKAIKYGCDKGGCDKWSPNQLRHSAATRIRARHGLEASQVILGHAIVETTQIYAERNRSLAIRIAGEEG